MGLLQLKLFLFLLLISAVCLKISVQFPTCGNNTFFIQYPFKLLQQGQNPHHTTPYALKCNTQGVVVLNLPFSGEFYVRDIDYFEQRIQLYDPGNCLPRRLKNLSLSSSPFVAVSYQKYTFFSCPLESRNFTAVRCLSNSTASVVATSETSTMDEIKNTTGCRVVYSLQIPVSRVFEYVYDGIDGDLQLAWSDPSSKEGKASSKPGALNIILICVVIISSALLAALFCLGCGLSVIGVMLDIDEANYQRSWSCSTTRVWEMARAPRGAAGPLDEVSFMYSTSQQPQSSPPLHESSSTPLPSSIAEVHPFGYYLSFMPSPEVPIGGASAPPDVAAGALDGSVSFIPSPELPSMAAVHDESSVISSTQVPGGPAAPLDETSSIPLPPPPPPPPPFHPSDYFLTPMPSGPPSVVSFMPSPEVQSMPITPHDDEVFIDAAGSSSPQFIDAAGSSSPQFPGGAAATLHESSSTSPPPSSVAEGRPFNHYFFSLLSFSAQFGRGAAAPPGELSPTPSSPIVDDDISVIPSPQHPGMDPAHEDDDDDDDDDEEVVPTEDIIIGGSECILGPNGDSCTICLGEYKASERLRLIQKCKHCFHADCLEPWLHTKNTCPICRTNVI